MNHEQFLACHKELCDKMHEICRNKNHDYAGGASHAFKNFTIVEQMGVTSTEQGFLTRMCDKMMRITNIVTSGKTAVKDESIEDTLLDLANYSLLMIGYLRSKKSNMQVNGGFGGSLEDLERIALSKPKARTNKK